MNWFGRIVAIAHKELRQLRRDRLTLGMIVGLPVLQLLLFGYAINQDVRHLRAGVADLAGTQRARIFIADAEASQVIDVVEQVHSAQALETLLRQGRIAVGLFIPHDFDRRTLRGDRIPAQLLVDGSDPLILNAARGLTHLPIEARGVTRAQISAQARLAVRAYYNPERRSAIQIIPGLIGVILTMTMVLFTAVAIVRERERGTLELLIDTPVRTPELMGGKIIPYIGIGLIQVSLILYLGVYLFALPIRGPLLDFYLGASIFICASLALGLLISTAAQTQMQAFQITVFFLLPSILLSGFMFPFDGMPRVAQYMAELLPSLLPVRLGQRTIRKGQCEGQFRFIADVLLHELIQQWQYEILGNDECAAGGHGPNFRNKCDEIGARLGLSSVRDTQFDGTRGVPSPGASWPQIVRPDDYYCGAWTRKRRG